MLEHGVDALRTRAIAEVAEVPVASHCQYFHDKEDILLALVERDMAEIASSILQFAEAAGLLSRDVPLKIALLASSACEPRSGVARISAKARPASPRRAAARADAARWGRWCGR